MNSLQKKSKLSSRWIDVDGVAFLCCLVLKVQFCVYFETENTRTQYKISCHGDCQAAYVVYSTESSNKTLSIILKCAFPS